jgi:hypothetical protein
MISVAKTATAPLQRWVVVFFVCCFGLCGLWFARAQNIWIDESTQLSGVRLSVPDMVAWLAGANPDRFGVPGDRMPPLGYLIDHFWWSMVGPAEFPFRAFHCGIAALGVAVVARSERIALGRHWTGAGLLFLVLSPKLIELAGELRCYPLFFATAAAVLSMFLDIVRRPGPLAWGKLIAFGIACLLLSYVHFFGVVASFAYFVTLLTAFASDRISRVRIVVIGGILATCLLGLAPFVFGAASVSPSGTTTTATDVIRYFPLLIGHPATIVFPIGAALFVSGFTTLCVLAGWGALWRARQRIVAPADWLILVVIVGCCATVLPAFVVSSFNTIKPSYSIWLLPVIALIIASGASRPFCAARWERFARFFALGLVLSGAAISTGVFVAKAEWFVHGPQRAIMVASAQSAEPRAIVYVEPDTYAYGYFPMVYSTGGLVQQWVASAVSLRRLPVQNGVETRESLRDLARYRSLVVVDIHLRRYTDLSDCLNSRCPAFPEATMVTALVASGRWIVVSSKREFGFYDTVITKLAARPAP